MYPLSPQSLLFIFLLIIIYLSLYASKKKSSSNVAIKPFPCFGVLPEFIKNRHRFLDWSSEVLARLPTNTLDYHHPGKVHGIITANPLNVEHMLKSNFHNYPKGSRVTSYLEDFLGRGIFNADGEIWKIQRKTASYEFNTKSLRNFFMKSVEEEIQTRLVPVLKRASVLNQVVDMQDILERFSFDTVCRLSFNMDPGCLGSEGTTGTEFMNAFGEASTYSAGRFFYALPYMWRIKKALNIGSEKRMRKAISIVHDFADDIIKSRMKEKGEKEDTDDLLSRFIANESNSAEFLRDIIISFMLAGRDTMTSSITWFFWVLSSRSDVEGNILHEMKSIRNRNGTGSEAFNFDDMGQMHYLKAALSESLRMYPPVPLDEKQCLQDDIMPDGTFVGKGWCVTYHAYAMGRMESIWGKDCLDFKPERWLENGICRQESPFRFPAFHAGPRICLGKDVAHMQMKMVVASVLSRFHLDLVDKYRAPKQILSLTLRMKDGLPMRVRERCEAAID
ncbi:PREDICTED: cytochrome P450 94B3-like [Nelumbo nucifera]|uniref:Cytochrome P450 94B3-like n=2 Tax=Nelumbo nucifera TaxID=4432 RepID=A0A822YIR0_NELNU|nr:PREDICTED: cytochrome P450 94B3-like [Nelumbo nucifera]DAD29288.1 TPA_asm: hypothetical protein HUJ06_030756 [Nelumbo nucifera]